MSLSASFLGDCCFPDISSRSLVAEICAGSLTTPLTWERGARTGAGEAALMTMVAAGGTEGAELADRVATVKVAGRGEAAA